MRKICVMNVDFGDAVHWLSERTSELYDEQRIEKFFAECAAHGVDSVNWRLSACGQLDHRSKVGTSFSGSYLLHQARMAEVLKRYNPPEIAIAAAHQHKIKITLWITLFDSFFFGLEDRYFHDHPHLYMMDRDAKVVMPGVPCYAYSETQDYRLREIKEAVAYGADGIYLCCRSHSGFAPEMLPPAGDGSYGYNPPVMEEFIRRYGIDPRKQEFDREALARLHGEYLSDFYAKASRIIHDAGQQCWLGSAYPAGGIHADFIGYTHFHPSEKIQVKIHLNWREWAQQGWIDAAIASGGQPFTKNNVTVPVYTFCSLLVNPKNPKSTVEACQERLLTYTQLAHDQGLDGIIVHQSTDFEFYPVGWDILEKARTIIEK